MKTYLLLGLCLLSLIGSTAPADAQIYKTIDKDGNVVFTDVPPQDAAEAIKLERGSSYAPPPLPPATDASPAAAEDAETEAPVRYASLAIVSPANDEALRDNAGNVTISITVTPELDSVRAHRIELLMDGEPRASTQGAPVVLSNVDRGTHVLTARVVDPDGNVEIASAPVTFHLLRYSRLQGGNP